MNEAVVFGLSQRRPPSFAPSQLAVMSHSRCPANVLQEDPINGWVDGFGQFNVSATVENDHALEVDSDELGCPSERRMHASADEILNDGSAPSSMGHIKSRGLKLAFKFSCKLDHPGLLYRIP